MSRFGAYIFAMSDSIAPWEESREFHCILYGQNRMSASLVERCLYALVSDYSIWSDTASNLGSLCTDADRMLEEARGPNASLRLRELEYGAREMYDALTASSPESLAVETDPVTVCQGYRPIGYFPQDMHDRIEKAAKPKRPSKRVRVFVADGVRLYSLSDAWRWWPHDLEAAGLNRPAESGDN